MVLQITGSKEFVVVTTARNKSKNAESLRFFVYGISPKGVTVRNNATDRSVSFGFLALDVGKCPPYL